jgi:hypothetical protein
MFTAKYSIKLLAAAGFGAYSAGPEDLSDSSAVRILSELHGRVIPRTHGFQL